MLLYSISSTLTQTQDASTDNNIYILQPISSPLAVNTSLHFHLKYINIRWSLVTLDFEALRPW